MVFMGETPDLRDFAIRPGDKIPATKRRQRVPGTKLAGRFLKGPVCWEWLAAAMRLPGRALHVAVIIQFQAGLAKSQTIALSSDELRRAGILRTTGYRALKTLERGGLVVVRRGKGRLPIVTIKPAAK
jgi:hypothetical protein